jgi:acyl-CoA thioester hydrolase
VRYADLDPRGHLNNVALLTFFEAARIMYLRGRFDEGDAHDLILVSQHIDYRAPGALGDELCTNLRPSNIRPKTFQLDFETMRDDVLVADGHGIYIGYDYERSAAKELSAAMSARLREDLES